MQRFIFKHLLRARYICEGRFFWRFATAKAFADENLTASAVYSINYQRLYHKHSYLWGKHIGNGEGW